MLPRTLLSLTKHRAIFSRTIKCAYYSTSNDIMSDKDIEIQMRNEFKNYDVSQFYDPNRSTRDVVLDFAAYVIPYKERLAYLNRILVPMSRVHPAAVVTIYDELDQLFKNTFARALMHPTALALATLGQLEAALKFLEVSENDHDLNQDDWVIRVKAQILIRAKQYDEAIKCFENATFKNNNSMNRLFMFGGMLVELANIGEGDLVMELVNKHGNADNPLHTEDLLQVIEALLEHDQLKAAQQIADWGHKKLRHYIKKGEVSRERLDALEKMFMAKRKELAKGG